MLARAIDNVFVRRRRELFTIRLRGRLEQTNDTKGKPIFFDLSCICLLYVISAKYKHAAEDAYRKKN